MNQKLYILSYCKIKNNTIFVDGDAIFSDKKADSFADFSKKAYKENKLSYPKFFKMDNLCKLAFLSAEFLAKQVGKFDKNTAIVLSNNASSLETDRSYQQTIQDDKSFYPSPAVFVYTLPNITIGEISIKHQLRSENVFFVSQEFNEELLFNYTSVLIANKKSNNVLCGWVNFDGESYNSFVYLVSTSGERLHTKEFIKELYLNN